MRQVCAPGNIAISYAEGSQTLKTGLSHPRTPPSRSRPHPDHPQEEAREHHDGWELKQRDWKLLMTRSVLLVRWEKMRRCPNQNSLLFLPRKNNRCRTAMPAHNLHSPPWVGT